VVSSTIIFLIVCSSEHNVLSLRMYLALLAAFFQRKQTSNSKRIRTQCFSSSAGKHKIYIDKMTATNLLPPVNLLGDRR
jgi:hypothetical protein